MFQNTNRNSDVALENVNFKNTQATIGIRYELFKDFDLLGGFVLQNTVGDDFIADRNSYTEVTYFTQQKYDIRQQLSGLGFRYNFTPKIYLSAIFQQGVFVDDTKSTANYNINQFGIIYNMLF
jgi:hypothetical protein